MAILETAILGVGSGIAKGVLRYWLGSESAPLQEHIWDNLVDVLKGKTDDVLAQRAADRQFQIIAEQSAENVIAIIKAEGSGIEEGRAEVLINMVGETVNQAIASPKLIVDHNLDPTKLTEHLITYGETSKTIKSIPENEQELFEDMLYEAAQHILDISSELPGFTEATFTELLKRDDLILGKANRILEEIKRLRKSTHNIKSDSASFENDFRRDVSRKLDELKLFGVDVSSTSKRYKLSVAYVSLMVEQRSSRLSKESSNDTTQEEMKVDDALLSSNKLFIRGPAGSGKTTLLQWIAVTSASRNHSESLSILNECIPFFIRLRAIGDSLPTPEAIVKLASPNIAGKMPHGWMHEKLENGNALILIDGLDEIAEERREDVKEWLKSLTENFPKVRYIISTRPHAAEEGWLDNEDFVETELQDMTVSDIHTFINHWHTSVRSMESIDENKNILDELEHKLNKTIQNNAPLRKLATSPLLCALICALHRDRIENLPTRRVELYQACVDMFLRRDIERKIISDNYPQIDETQKRTILQELALWMMRGKMSEVAQEDADKRIDITINSLQSMPDNATGTKIRRLFIERSGILREPTAGMVDFPHRTFQEYLAAQAALDDIAITELINNAHNDQWHETIILAAGLARPVEAEELIIGLINRGDKEKQHQHAIYLLAVAAQQGINKLPQDSIIMEKVSKRLEKIVPPKNLSEAKTLSAAGDLVVPYLSYTQQILKYALPNIRCLALIGTENSFNELDYYLEDKRVGVLDEFSRSQKHCPNPNDYAKRFLYHRWFNFIDENNKCEEKEIDLSRKQIQDIEKLKFCTNLTELNLNFTVVNDLSPLITCKKLKVLKLKNTEVTDLSPLSNCLQLTELDLSGTKIRDLSPLKFCRKLKVISLSDSNIDIDTIKVLSNLESLIVSNFSSIDVSPFSELHNLNRLSINAMEIKDLSPLVECKNLETLTLSSYLSMDLSHLEKLVSLKNLEISCFSEVDLSPLALCGKLEKLILDHVSRLHKFFTLDISPVASCKKLKHLSLSNTSTLSLKPLSELIDLEVLELNGNDESQFPSLNNCEKLESLNLSYTNVRDVSFINECKELKCLLLNNTDISDISDISSLKKLEVLNLSKTDVEDLTALSGCSSLLELELENTKINDLSPLSSCVKLEKIILWRCPVKDISVLKNCINLIYVDLDNTQVVDISPLANCNELKVLDILGTNITDLSSVDKQISRGLNIRK